MGESIEICENENIRQTFVIWENSTKEIFQKYNIPGVPLKPIMSTQSLTPHILMNVSAALDEDLRNGDLTAALNSYRRLAMSEGASPTVLLELGQVELDSGQPAVARETFRRLLASQPGEPLQGRASLLLATADLALGNWEAVLARIDPEGAPDGLADLAALQRAEAAIEGGNLSQGRKELGRSALRQSTNALLLERAWRLAEQVALTAMPASRSPTPATDLSADIPMSR